MEYLFWSQFIFWITIIGYIYYLHVKVKGVERQIDGFNKSERGDSDVQG